MKPLIQSVIITLLVVWSITAHSADTNMVFLPQDPGIYGDLNGKQYEQLKQRLMAEALQAGECRPAELDPAGHWGESTCGFQMSIRSDTNTFIQGSNMLVVVILRNTSTNTLARMVCTDDCQTTFQVQDESGHPRIPSSPSTEVDFADVPPKRQVKFAYDLNRLFQFPPGVYKVSAKQFTFDAGAHKSFGEVSSGSITIKVIPPNEPVAPIK